MAKPAVFALLSASLFFVSAPIAFAALSPLHPDLCPSGASSGPPPVTTKLTLSEEDRIKNQTYLRQINACPNACYDLVFVLSIIPNSLGGDHTMVVDTKVTDICKPANEENLEKTNRGCTKGQNEPRLSIEMKEVKHPYTGDVLIPAKIISSKSRCDKTISNIVDSMFAKASPDTEDIVAALEELGKRPEAGVAGPPDATLTSAIDQAFGKNTLTTDALREIEESSVSDRIAALAKAGKYEEAAQVAETAKLSQRTISEIKALDPASRPEVLSGGPVGGDIRPTSQVTGLNENVTSSPAPLPGGRYGELFKNAEQEFGLPPGYLAGVAKLESAGNPNVCAGISSACGLFQYTEGTWKIDSARINGGVPLPLSARFDPETAARVTAGSVAYYEQQYGSLINQSGMDERAAYFAFHNLGEGGAQRFIKAFAANPSAPAYTALTPVEIRNNPSLYGNGSISLAQAQANMLAGMGGSTAFTAATPRGFVPGSSPFSNLSPFTTTRPVGSAGPVGTSGGGASGNPFTQLFSNLLGGGSSGGQSAPSTQGSGAGQNTQQIPQGSGQQNQGGTSSQIPGGGSQQGSQSSSSSGSPVQQLLDALTPGGSSPPAPAVPVDAVASLLVQPSEVERGDSLVISWSSVGTSSSAPCHVTLTVGTSTTVVAQGNEGTRSIQTSDTTPTGSWDFRLRCTAAIDGELLERDISASVR